METVRRVGTFVTKTFYEVQFFWKDSDWTNWHCSPRRKFRSLEEARAEEARLAEEYHQQRFRVIKIQETREVC